MVLANLETIFGGSTLFCYNYSFSKFTINISVEITCFT